VSLLYLSETNMHCCKAYIISLPFHNIYNPFAVCESSIQQLRTENSGLF